MARYCDKDSEKMSSISKILKKQINDPKPLDKLSEFIFLMIHHYRISEIDAYDFLDNSIVRVLNAYEMESLIDLYIETGWNSDDLFEIIKECMVSHIVENIHDIESDIDIESAVTHYSYNDESDVDFDRSEIEEMIEESIISYAKGSLCLDRLEGDEKEQVIEAIVEVAEDSDIDELVRSHIESYAPEDKSVYKNTQKTTMGTIDSIRDIFEKSV